MAEVVVPDEYSSLTFTMISPDILTISYDDPIIDSISVDENGNTVTVFYPDTYSGPIGKAEEKVVSRILAAPDLFNRFIYTDSQNYIVDDIPCVSYLDIFWDPVEYATGYQVFIIIDQSAAVLFESLGTTSLLNYKGFSPLFSDQSGLLDPGTTNFRFDFKGLLEVKKLHALVFSYNGDTVGIYPKYMITCVPSISRMFIEKTSYRRDENRYITIGDDSENLPGTEINVEQKIINTI